MKSRIRNLSFATLSLLMVLGIGAAQAQTFTVTTTADTGAGSLRDAITQLNVASGTAHSIVFNAALDGQTIDLSNTANPLPPFALGSNTTVDINPTAVNITISGGSANRIFFFANLTQSATGTTYNITKINFVNFKAKGGNGGSGAITGGGGAGLGGAIFADAGMAINVTTCTFNSGGAFGGDGGFVTGTGNGGGGGLGGLGGGANGGNGGGGGLGGSGGFGSTGASGGGGGIQVGFTDAQGGNAPGASGSPGGFTGTPGGTGGSVANTGGTNAGGGGSGNNVSNQHAAGGGGISGGNATATKGGDGGYGGGGGGGDSVAGAGNGGFGGGGGGTAGAANGIGGFGGGGGGGGGTSPAGKGGFGGGSGGNSQASAGFGGGAGSATAGGGGLGAGGAIFVRAGSTLTVTDSTYASLAIAGGAGSQTGLARGSGIFLGGDVTLNVSGSNLLVLGSGDFLGGGVDAEAQGKLTKNGMGILQLDTTNSYVGGTVINAGFLIVNETIGGNASATGTGPVTIGNMAALGGGNATGTVGSVFGDVTVNAGGSVIPGVAGPGTLSLRGNVTFSATSSLNIAISAPGTFSKIKVDGTLNLGGADLLLAGPGYTPQVADSFVIVVNNSASPIQGTFNNLAEGGKIVNVFGSGLDAQVSYVGGDGNDVSLTIVAGSGPAGPTLSGLFTSDGSLSPAFSPSVTTYDVDVSSDTTSILITALTAVPSSTLVIDGVPNQSGFPSQPIFVFPGSNLVQVTVTDQGGTNHTDYLLSINVAQAGNQPPSVPPLNSDNNPALINTLVSYTFTAFDPDDSTLTYTFNFGDDSAEISGSFSSGDPVTLSHTYTSYSDAGMIVSLTVSDGMNPPVTVTTLQTVPMPSSTGAGTTNVAIALPPVVSPLDGLGISVAAADGGVIQLNIDVNSLTRAAYSVSTDWGDTVGRTSTVTGTQPVHQFNSRGLFVAKSTATNKDTNQKAGKGRLTLALSSNETGDFPTNVQHLRALPRSAPTNDSTIATKSIKGKFDFSGKKPDLVTFQGSIKLPAGIDPSKPYEFWIALGNIVVKTTIVKGKGTNPSVVGVLKSLKVSSKIKKGAITTGEETAAITVVYSSKNTTGNGFDTEGIDKNSTDVPTGKSAPRKIQVAMLVEGAPFQSVTPVDFSISKKGDFGGMSGRSGN